MKISTILVLLLAAAASLSGQSNPGDEGGRILAFESAWGHALEAKDAKAIDSILDTTFVAVDFDGSIANKRQYLAGIKAPGYQASQAVNEQATVNVYGDAAVVIGIFRIKGTEKGKPYLRRERFTDTWIKRGQSWQCVASQVTLIAAK